MMIVPLFDPVYTNRDGLTGFGMPWEIRFQSNYTVLRKGGNVGGYSALFSFVPELQLSKKGYLIMHDIVRSMH